jgi:hypothetical protein
MVVHMQPLISMLCRPDIWEHEEKRQSVPQNVRADIPSFAGGFPLSSIPLQVYITTLQQ